MSEPIESGGKLNKTEEGDGEFVVTGADAAMAFEAAEEVFDFVAPPIVAAVEGHRPPARTFGRDADARALSAQTGAKSISIETLVADDPPAAHAGKQWFDGVQIMTLAFGQPERHGPPAAVNDRRQFGVDATFRAPNCLLGLPAAGIRAVLVQLDMRTIDIAQLPLRALREDRQHAREQPRGTPAAEARVDRVPRTKVGRQVPPRNPGAQNIEHGGDHKLIVFGRPTPARPAAAFGAFTVNFFSRRHNGFGSLQRSINFMRTLRSSPAFVRSIDFENTP